MSTTNLIIGLALGVLFGGLIIAFRTRFRDVFAALLVLGVVVLAVVVTIMRVDQYREEKATGTPVAESQASRPAPRCRPARRRSRRSACRHRRWAAA